jgi:acyl-CoA thioester hydrolase
MDAPPLLDAPGAAICPHRVLYGEVDRMGYVYYGQYPLWFEEGRTEVLRALGHAYRDLEDSGLFLPVRRLEIRYHAPIRYDALVTVVTVVQQVRRASVAFRSAVYDEDEALCTDGAVELAAVDATGRPTRLAPGLLADLRSAAGVAG